MSEERLKEIKELMDNEIRIWGKGNKFVNQHLELYNEVIRLRETLNKINHVMNNQMNYGEYIDIVDAIDDILEQNNLTLEQLTGFENE